MDEIYEPEEDSKLLEKYVKTLTKGVVLDMGTGSGIQSKAAYDQASKIYAVDINEKAIIHCKNIFKGDKKIEVIKSSLFENLSEELIFDTIIFNAPYLPLDEGDKDIALDGNIGGFKIIELFLEQARPYLAQSGIILLIFSSKSGDIISLFKKYNYEHTLLEKIHIFFEDIFCYKLNLNPFVKICPKCGSTNIMVEGFKYTLDSCNDCGFQIQNFPEIEITEIEEFKKQLKDDNF